MKERLDNLVCARGLADSREQAKRLILAGRIRVDGHPVTKAGNPVPTDSLVECTMPARFVSRGGEKLEGAFQEFNLVAEGRDCLDVGASTGGFTDCLLQHGAARVIALDVGRAQLHPSLRNDTRVTVMEGINARYLTADQLPFLPELVVVDVAFISLTLILPPVRHILKPGGEIVALVKPQFEAGRQHIKRGGVVRDKAVHEDVCRQIREFGEGLGLQTLGLTKSPLLGPKGNVEFLIYFRDAG